MYRIAIITASDKGALGERVDVSGQVIREMCQEFATVTSYAVLAPKVDFDSLNQVFIIKSFDIVP